jgi:hypothetical protein
MVTTEFNRNSTVTVVGETEPAPVNINLFTGDPLAAGDYGGWRAWPWHRQLDVPAYAADPKVIAHHSRTMGQWASKWLRDNGHAAGRVRVWYTPNRDGSVSLFMCCRPE